MNAREVVIGNIENQDPGRIGFCFGPAPDGTPRRNDLVWVGVEYQAKTKTWVDGEMEYFVDVWGNVWHRFLNMSQGGEVCKPVLENWNDMDNLELPDLGNPDRFFEARRIGASEDELFRIGTMPGWCFDICRYMRKMEIYFTDLIAERENIQILHGRITSLLEQIIDQFGEAGLDAIFFFEDLGTQIGPLIGPPMWNEIYRPLYERLTSRAHGYGMKVIQHSCGYNWDLIDDLCEAGIDCFQFDQPALYDLPGLAGKLKTHGVGLFSPCDIQKALPTGNRGKIERETKRLVQTFRGGFIAKQYPDLPGIGVAPQWDQWAYEAFELSGV